MDCIFCKIVRGEISSSKVYEDENFLAFLDIHPVRPGHTLVIPKQHYDDLLTTPPSVVSDLYQIVQKISAGVVKGVGAEGFNLGLNNGRAAGQIIFHTHVHIIPRVAKDGLEMWGQHEYNENQIAEVAISIKQSLL